MTTHSPLIRLTEARRNYHAAQGACVHWDMEGNCSDHECCRELDDAGRALNAARKACAKATGESP
jgi:hypothetical protein